MKATGNLQINNRVYWNEIYMTPARNAEYWSHSSRYDILLEEIKDGDTFIDFGCGVAIPGRLIRGTRKNCEIWGTDISDKIIEKNTHDDKEGKYYQGYVGYQTFLPNDYFDVVWAGELIEHLDDPNVLFKEAYRVLKKGGRLILSTPHENAVTSPEHVWEFTEDDVKFLYASNNFTDIRFKQLNNLEHLVIIFAIGVK